MFSYAGIFNLHHMWSFLYMALYNFGLFAMMWLLPIYSMGWWGNKVNRGNVAKLNAPPVPAKPTKLVDTKPKFRNMRGKYTPKPVSPEERARRKRNAEAFRNYVRGIGTK